MLTGKQKENTPVVSLGKKEKNIHIHIYKKNLIVPSVAILRLGIIAVVAYRMCQLSIESGCMRIQH